MKRIKVSKSNRYGRFWKLIVTIIVIIPGVFGAVFGYYQYKDIESKELKVVVTENLQVIQAPESFAKDLTVLYKGHDVTTLYKEQKVNNLFIITMKLQNCGNRSIEVNDYENREPIKFIFKKQVKVLDAKIYPKPENINMTATTISNTMVYLSPALLNEGDEVKIKFLVFDVPSGQVLELFSVLSRISGIPEIRVENKIGIVREY